MALSPPRTRKAFIFTTVATVLVLVLVIFATSETRTLSRTQTQTVRVHTMVGYLDSLDGDLPRVAYIATFRGLIALEEHVSSSSEYLFDIDGAFREVFVNGTVNGTPYVIMNDSTFTDFANRFAVLAARQGMNANLTVLNLSAVHNSPWTVLVTVTVNLTIYDTAGAARLNRVRIVTSTVPIFDIKDPAYSVGTLGRSPNPVKQSNVTRPYITAGNDPTKFILLANTSAYIADTDAPSFLMRFSGNFSASPYGIQSLVNLDTLRAQELVLDKCRSIVDYHYFNGSTVPNYYINNTDAQTIWLTDGDLADYDATGKTAGTVPRGGC